MRPRAVLWDLDGTLLDSAACHFLAWREILAAEGIALSRARFDELFGLTNEATLHAHFGPDLPRAELERIALAKEACFRRSLEEGSVSLMPGAADWLERLRVDGWQQALATSAPRVNAEAALSGLGVREYFRILSTVEDVVRGKPDPAVYLVAAARLGVPPERCVVVEDAPHGVEGAHRAGMRAIGVGTGPWSPLPDLAVASLRDLPPGAVAALVT